MASMRKPVPRRNGLLACVLFAFVVGDWLFPQARDFMVQCCDNSGAWNLKVVGRVGAGRNEQGDYRKLQAGDQVVVVGRTGGAKNRIMRAVVVRTRKMSANPLQNGFKVCYDT
eukprot:CAMPEP_0195132588 /NCGR_PEP_ID=MMETSP0448-20130528/147169_1 /TAXON_ID=66468 /ORGANISM="Heterocapsa triquestra, Strain CCMP 448" /LENGTH=112 /DNA_ID=CAMNT_0040170605 /DNA_START=58 /DNA_END=392 /DNA_ORIENTATION=-